MANYPSLPQSEGTVLVPRSGVRVRYTTNGAARTRAVSSGIRYDVTVIHKGMTAADVTTFKDFYTSNRAVTFQIAYDAGESLSLTCVFAEKPFDIVSTPGPGANAFFEIRAYLIQAD